MNNPNEQSMSEARKILNMIETVSPDDTGRLNEIDARVYCWWQGNVEYVSHRTSDIFGAILKCRQIQESIEYPAGQEHVESNVPQFTRSRDALKAIRPKGYFLCIESDEDGCYCRTWKGCSNFHSGVIKTEEIAELHAIVQAIEYERENGYTTTI